MFEDSSPQKNAHALNIHVFFLVHQLRVLLALSFVSLPYLFDKCLDMYFPYGRDYIRDA